MKTVKSETWELRMRKLLVQAMCILLFILALCSAAPISFAQDGLQETDDALSTEEMLNLGLSYYNGDGVQQNYSTAQKWFEKSAEEGSAEAAFYLGQMYFEGNGVKRSYGQAREWFIKAADAGNTDAMRMLGYFYLAGVGVVPSEAEGTAFYEKAIALGDPEAIAQYGSILFQGYGCVARDEVKAKEFLENAGNFRTADGLQVLERELYKVASFPIVSIARILSHRIEQNLAVHNLCAWPRQQTQNAHGGHALSAAGLAHQRKKFARENIKRNTVRHLQRLLAVTRIAVFVKPERHRDIM